MTTVRAVLIGGPQDGGTVHVPDGQHEIETPAKPLSLHDMSRDPEGPINRVARYRWDRVSPRIDGFLRMVYVGDR